MARNKKTNNTDPVNQSVDGIFSDQSNDAVNKEKQKQAIKSITGQIKNFSDFQKGFGVFANSQVSANKKLMSKMEDNDAQLKEYKDQTKELLKSIGSLVKDNNKIASQPKNNKKTKEQKDNKNFDEKARLERSILGSDDIVADTLKSINSDTSEILKILKDGLPKGKPKPTNDESGGLGALLTGGLISNLIAGGVAAALGAASPNAASGARTAINVLPTAARAVAPITNAGKGIAAAVKGVRSFGGTTGIGAAAKAALSSIKGIPSGYNAKDFLVGEQKIGKLGALGAAAGVGATYGRYAEGDTTGAILQGLSTALPLALSKTKFGKIATLGSAATDVGLLVRDYFKTDEDKAKEKAVVDARNAKDKESQEAQVAAAANDPAVKIADNTTTTNTLLTDIKNYFVNGGKLDKSANGMAIPASGGNGLMLGGLATLGIAGAVLSRGKLGGIFPRIAAPTGAASGLASRTFTPITAASQAAVRAPLVNPASRTLGNTAGAAAQGASGLGKLGTLAKFGAKAGGKAIPLVGLGLGAMGAYDKLKQGDGFGAALEFGAGAASLIPVVGTAASIALTGVSAARDTAKEGGSTGDAMLTGGLSAAMMAGTYGLAGGVGKLLKGSADNAMGAVGKNVGDASKSLTDTAKDASKGVAKGAKDTQEQIKKTSSLLAQAGTSLKTNVEKMFTNVNGTLLGTIAKFSAIGLVGGGIAAGVGGLINRIGQTDQQRLRTTLGQGIIGNSFKDFGSVSAAFESGSRGVSTISTGKGDKGGVSYGRHQMTGTTMTAFLNSSYGARYKNEFGGAKAGTSQFNNHYKRIASVDGENFEIQQKKFIDANYFGVASSIIKNKTGMDILKRGRALQELVYSSAVQYGPHAVAAWFTAGSVLGSNPAALSDEEIITRIMDYKAKNVSRHFKNSSADVQQGVANRIVTEKQMLLNINAKNGGVTAGKQTSSIPKTGSTGKVASAPKTGAGVTTNKTTGASAQPDEATKQGSVSNAAYLKLGMENVSIQSGVNMAGLNPTVRNSFYTMVGELFATKKPRAKVIVTSAFRSREQQEQLWKQKGQDTSKVARPGTSRHEKGYAIDIDNKSTGNGDLLESSGLLRKYGFSRPLKNEPWHIEFGSGGVAASNDDSVSGMIGTGGTEEGVEEGADFNPDQDLSHTENLITKGLEMALNSEAMDAVRDFMKGDIYRTGDKTPLPIAAGKFTVDKDEADPNKKLTGDANNGDKDDLSQVLGSQKFEQQERSANYEKTRAAMQGTDKVQDLQRSEDYEKVRKAMQGDNKVKNLVGGIHGLLGGKNSWIFDLLNGLGIGGDGLLGEVIQIVTGQKDIKNIDLKKMLPIATTPYSMSDAVGGFGGGIAGGVIPSEPKGVYTPAPKVGDVVYNTDGTPIQDISSIDGIGTINKSVSITPYETAEGEFTHMDNTSTKLEGDYGATMDEKGFTPKLNGGVLGKITSVLNGGLNDLGGLAGVAGSLANGSFDAKSLLPSITAAAIDTGMEYFGNKVSYDDSEKQSENMEMAQAFATKKEEEKRNSEINVNIPEPIQTNNGGGNNARGKSGMNGLDGDILVKNPDTIPHAVAVSLMKHSI